MIRGLGSLCVLVCVSGCAPTVWAVDAGGETPDAPIAPRDAPPIDGAPHVDLLARLADPYAPARPAPGAAFLRSSRQPEEAAGMLNRDFNWFDRRVGERGVLLDEPGPGVVTRIWLTVGGDPDLGIGGSARLYFFVDGAPVSFAPGEDGITVNALTSGLTPGFPRPWARDREAASGGYFVALPIHYRERIRIEMTAPEALWNYFQVDGFSLPPGTEVTSFTGSPSPDDEAALAEATRIWEAHEHPGTLDVAAPRMLAAGESVTLTVTAPAIVTEIVVDAPVAERGRIEVALDVDGATAARASVAALLGTGAPAGTYSSALTASDPAQAHLFAPLPLDRSATITLTLGPGPDALVGLRARIVPGAPPAELGHFRADCRVSVSDVPYSVCEAQPLERHPNVVVSELSTATPAQYVGQTYVETPPPLDLWWWSLENDHEVFVDGVATLLGTGTEDYFGGGFYFALGPYASPTSGASGWTRTPGLVDTHLYRWHLIDGVPFARSLRFEYESYFDETTWAGCSFYYVFDR